MPVTDHELDVLLHEAAALVAKGAPGVAVRTDDPDRLRHRLYPRMKACGIHFKLRIPQEPESLWLLEKPK